MVKVNTEITPIMAKEDNLRPAWSKGESGNPNGRPKGSKNRSTIARKWLEVEQKLNNPITGETEKMSQEDIMTLALIKKSREGDVQAYRALMDSAYHQSLMLVNDPDNPIDITTFQFNLKKDAD